MEYILENENQNIAEISGRLGITPSAFSKNVKKMVDKGLLEKYHMTIYPKVYGDFRDIRERDTVKPVKRERSHLNQN